MIPSLTSQVGRCTDEEYRTYATSTPSPSPSAAAQTADGSSSTNENGSNSSSSRSQSSIASVSTATDSSSSPSLRKIELDWENEGISWNADGSLVFKLDEITNS